MNRQSGSLLGFLVSGFSGNGEIVKSPVQIFERRPIHRFRFPAIQHDVVQRVRTCSWLRMTITTAQSTDDLVVLHACKTEVSKQFRNEAAMTEL